jgi:dihydrofolate reductase
MGSISLVSSLVSAGLADRLRLMLFPLTCRGAGRDPIFRDGALERFELKQTRTLDERVVLLEYRTTDSGRGG